MTWVDKDPKTRIDPNDKSTMPSGLWRLCDACKESVFAKDFQDNWNVCPRCNTHYRMSSRTWVSLLFGDHSFTEYDAHLSSDNPLNFSDSKPYSARLTQTQDKTGLTEAAITVRGAINEYPLYVTILDFSFLGGSMGSVVGEKVARGAERALSERVPFMTILCTGGARMQEGMLSLMQMAKSAIVLARLRIQRIPYFVYLADPSTAGCLASFGMVGDIIMAEPGALIGFAGPRVIEQTIGEKLPADFQRAEFQLKHGMVDLVIDRRQLRNDLARLLRFFHTPSPLRLPVVKDFIKGVIF